MNIKIKEHVPVNLLTNPTFLGIVWVALPIIGAILKYKNAFSNNFAIFTGSFWHALNQTSLYAPYPQEYNDIFLYGIPFTALIAPFAVLPHAFGALLWNIAGVLLLYAGVRGLKMKRWQLAVVVLVAANEIYMTALGKQFNTAIAGFVILSFALLENKKPFWSALMLMIGAMTKIYGIVGLAFLPFTKSRLAFIGGLIFWGVVLLVIPMLYSSPEYVLGQYAEWMRTLAEKDAKNTYTLYTNVSFIGMVHRVTGWLHFSNLWLIIPGLLLFASPYLRIKQYDSKEFRLLFLASTLLFMVLFSTGTEESGYITAMVAVGIWYVATPTREKSFILNTALLLYCIIFSSFTQSDIFPQFINRNYLVPYSLKALPCTIIWFKIIYELLTKNFIKDPKPLIITPDEKHSIDIILPCYNPHEGWSNILIEKYNEFQKKLPHYNIHFIVVNDGSKSGINKDICNMLQAQIPSITIINNTQNRGKGSAVRDGLAKSKSNIILYTDYDFPYTVHSMYSMIKQLELGYDVVIATRNSTYYSKLSMRRKMISYGIRILNFIILGMNHPDTQGGLKGFNIKGKEYLQKTTINHFLFDTEFIYHVSQSSEMNIKEMNADLREDVHFSNFKNSTLITEVGNLIKIAIKG